LAMVKRIAGKNQKQILELKEIQSKNDAFGARSSAKSRSGVAMVNNKYGRTEKTRETLTYPRTLHQDGPNCSYLKLT
jgi:hypothetical protein